MKQTKLHLTLGTGLLALAGIPAALAQLPSYVGHYPAGVEGVQAATLPPPGLYLRDYNYFYHSDNLKVSGAPENFDVFAYIQAPRLVWITDLKILGANYGADVLVPFVYQDLTAGPFKGSDFGLGDVFVEPITLSWHLQQFDIALGYGFWAPTGDSDKGDPVAPGKGYWTQMITAGGTWYADKQKTWSASLLGRYEFNSIDQDWDIRPGQALTLEWGVGKQLSQMFNVGFIGYWQQQTTSDSGQGAQYTGKDGVVAIGPEIGFSFPKQMLFITARYEFELNAVDRPEGGTGVLTITKRF